MTRKIFFLAVAAALMMACKGPEPLPIIPDDPTPSPSPGPAPMSWTTVTPVADSWDGTKRADITYQLLVYSFADSGTDGWGDLKGITQHLDYLDKMGVSALWLSPIHPADSYHGYNAKDYYSVRSEFGTDADLQELIAKAGEKGIKIYLDYVLNHTGAGNPWFQSACSSAESEYRDYYVISSTPEADIKAGKIPSLSSYNSTNWYSTGAGGSLGYKGRLHFVLDWSGSVKKVTVTETTDAAQPSNTDTSVNIYVYFGNEKLFRLYKTGNDIYEIILDFDSDWGFLVRTSATSWDAGTKFGGNGAPIQFGTAYNLNNSGNVGNITFGKSDYYYAAFPGGLPDLNYGELANLETNTTFNDVAASAKKWIEMGIGGFRLDAVLYIYEKDIPNGNNTFLKAWYDRCNQYYKAVPGNTGDIYMVGEAWTGTDAMAQYYKGLPALFDFEYWDRLSWAINNSTGKYFTKDILNIRSICKAVRSSYIEATKLTNHDQTRAATTLGKSLAKEKLAACVLLTSPGSPYIYQGEELGYWGKIGHEGGADEQVRTPIKWTKSGTVPSSWTSASNIDKNMLSADISVEAQDATDGSLLKVYQQFTRLRNAYPALAQGEMTAHGTYNDSNSNESYKGLAAWYMTSGSQKLLVVHNFGSSSVTANFPADKLETAIGLNGAAKTQGNTLQLDAYSTVIFMQ